jgi:ADP-ribose pyrophosphatase YjhB (NUDIX family)
MSARCWNDAPEYGNPCRHEITHMMYDGIFSCEEHAYFPVEKRAVVLYLPINGQILMMYRDKKVAEDPETKICTWVPDYALPGGKVEPGETDWDAIVRETYEETRLDITDPTPLFVRTSAADTGRSVTAFTARLVSDPLQDLGCRTPEGEPVWGPPEWLVEPQCTYRTFNGDLLAKIGVIT